MQKSGLSANFNICAFNPLLRKARKRYLTLISSILESEKQTHLNENITIVPVGGLDKVSTFISLLRDSKLNVACLLFTCTGQKGKQKVDDLVKYKIIKDKNIGFFDEFAINGKSVLTRTFFKSDTLDKFEKMFTEINKLY